MVSEAVFIGGRSGSGKTSVGFEVHAKLSAAGVAHCLIDGDFLDMAYPAPQEHNLAERNLAAMWQNYRELGYHRMLYTNTASVLPEEIKRLSAAIGGNPKITAILLTCTDATARKRLSQREIGSALERHLTSSKEMSARLQAGADAAHRIATDDRTVAEIAADIIRISGW
ncbi:adenylylsulfate kinase [Mycolicibacterium wolinskyi]|uniref:Adenylylsulfate kinase n=1 Tax=Mycolicibacterium wolinskyi TaxID=59750 RepID=A0A132PCA1_9MYCO|nr:adenylyl-sulfate kinase [Mycolicibacterium wolinskyi]KWX19965.1 adenylylsulfate kinase [Mycolicibacterium wolinskyi]